MMGKGGSVDIQVREAQGTTLAWTEHYGARDPLDTRLEGLQDLLFALTLAVFTAGVVGFVTHQAPPRISVTASVVAPAS
jgi:hypothetical protein